MKKFDIFCSPLACIMAIIYKKIFRKKCEKREKSGKFWKNGKCEKFEKYER